MSSTPNQPSSNSSRAMSVLNSSRRSQLREYRSKNLYRFHPYPSRKPSVDTIEEEEEEPVNDPTTTPSNLLLLHRFRVWAAGGLRLNNIGVGRLRDFINAVFGFVVGLRARVWRTLGWRQ